MRVLLCLAGLFAFAAAHTCPPLWTSGPRGCYRYMSTPKSWEAARAICNGFSSCDGGVGDLVSITSEAETTFLALLRQASNMANPAPSFWTGGNDQLRENAWQWSNGQMWQYTNWEQGQPDNRGGSEDCMRFPGQRSVNQWDDWDCFTELPSVCHLLVEEPTHGGQNPNQPGQGGPGQRPAFIYGLPDQSQNY